MSACTAGTDPVTPSSPIVDERTTAVLDAYASYWLTFMEASNPPNPESANLAKFAGPPELDNARAAIAARAKVGEGLSGSYSHQDSASLTSPTSAVVLDCLAVNANVVDLATGIVKSTTPNVPVAVSVDMTLDSGQWMVTRIANGTQLCTPTSTPLATSSASPTNSNEPTPALPTSTTEG